MSTDYTSACNEAATAQGLDPITAALTAAGIDHDVAQTGGFCMVIEITSAHDAGAKLCMTADTAEDGEALVCYLSADAAQGEADEVLVGDLPIEVAVATARSFVDSGIVP